MKKISIEINELEANSIGEMFNFICREVYTNKAPIDSKSFNVFSDLMVNVCSNFSDEDSPPWGGTLRIILNHNH